MVPTATIHEAIDPVDIAIRKVNNIRWLNIEVSIAETEVGRMELQTCRASAQAGHATTKYRQGEEQLVSAKEAHYTRPVADDEPEQKLFTDRLVLIWCYVQAEHAVNGEWGTRTPPKYRYI